MNHETQSWTNNRHPETDKLEKALIEKFGAREFAQARARARFKAEFARVMKMRRIELQMDQKDLATRLKTTQQQLSKYELGETSPTIERIYDICDALNLDFEIREKDSGKQLLCTCK